MNYEIKPLKEIWNGFLHIVVGIIVAHTFLPYLPLYAILLILLTLGIIREYIQFKRNKIQPLYIQIIDVLTIALGGLIWWLVITHFNINVDIL